MCATQQQRVRARGQATTRQQQQEKQLGGIRSNLSRAAVRIKANPRPRRGAGFKQAAVLPRICYVEHKKSSRGPEEWSSRFPMYG